MPFFTNRMKDLNIHISAGSMVTGILLLLLVAVLFFLRDIVLVVLTAIVIASSLEPAVRFFVRYKIPRALSVLLVYVFVAGAFVSVLFFFIPPVLDDAAGFINKLPQTIETLDFTRSSGEGFIPGTDVPVKFNLSEALADIRSSLSNVTGSVFTTLATFFGGFLSFVLIVVFSFYFAVQETGIDDFLRVITPLKHQAYVISLWKRSQDKIGKWMQGQLVLGLIVGVMLYLGLVILGVPHALLLAVLAALFELIPVFGQILAAIPAVLLAFGGGGVTLSLLVVGLYVIVQQFENHLIYPLVVKKVVGVPPLLVILALIVGAEIAGFLGILLSVPIAAVIQEFVVDVQKTKERELAQSKRSA